LSSFDLFHFYRFLLALIASIYSLVQLTIFVWRWQGLAGRTQGASLVLYRYFVVLLLRARFRRFFFELSTIAGLAAVLALLVALHWR
jgi:hypothetical protein